jgi:hypothetical protein
MHCHNCGTSLPDNAAFCPECGVALTAPPPSPNFQVPLPVQTKKPITKRWWFWTIMVVVTTAIIVSQSDNSDGSASSANTLAVTSSTPDQKSGELTFDDTFEFDKLEITLSSDISWTSVDNQFSDHHGKDVIVIPMTIKNISDKSRGLNIFYFKTYGSQGVESPSLDFYFEDSIPSSGDLRPGAEKTVNLYVLYDGDGDYYVEFEIIRNPVEVRLPIAK